MPTTPEKGPRAAGQPIRLVVSGLGNIGRRFLEILEHKAAYLRARYGLTFQVIGAADSRGAAIDLAGLDLADIVRLKEGGQSVTRMIITEDTVVCYGFNRGASFRYDYPLTYTGK